MLKLSRIVKSYKETGALNENVSVYGFLDDQVFLTKGGDVGVVLRVEGVDYECLDYRQTDSLTKRLESALRLLDRSSASINSCSSQVAKRFRILVMKTRS